MENSKNENEIFHTKSQKCENVAFDMNTGKIIIKNEFHDQTAKADAGKLRLTLVPPQIIYDIAEVRMYGCVKYPDGGPDNWKRVEAQRYRDAAFRHFLAYLKDPNSVDPESGIKHRKHLECNFAFLAELEDG